MFQSSPKELDASERFNGPTCPVTKIASEFEPFSEAYIKNPFDFFKRARQEEPIFYDPKSNYWVVLNYTDIVNIFRDFFVVENFPFLIDDFGFKKGKFFKKNFPKQTTPSAPKVPQIPQWGTLGALSF